MKRLVWLKGEDKKIDQKLIFLVKKLDIADRKTDRTQHTHIILRWKWAGRCLMTIPFGMPSRFNSFSSKAARSMLEISSAVSLCRDWSTRAEAVYSIVSKPYRVRRMKNKSREINKHKRDQVNTKKRGRNKKRIEGEKGYNEGAKFFGLFILCRKWWRKLVMR